nr:hypothetical protein [Bacteroidales bacterium]
MIAIKRFCYYTILLSFVFLTQNKFLYAQDTDSVLFTKDFFDNDIALDLTLRFDIKKFINEKMDE